MDGFNLIASIIPEDILTTVEAINSSMSEPVMVQTKQSASVYDWQFEQKSVDFFMRFFDKLDAAFGLYSVLAYCFKPQNKVHLYAYSRN